jgi:Cys-rich four helix bundle protein (predicted Tat secretion target)
MVEHESHFQSYQQPTSGLTRRDVLLGIGAIASVAYAGAAVSAMPRHDHSKHSPQLPELLTAATDCVDKGQRCITHCLVSFREGDVSLAECASKVHEMQAVCTAFSYLLAANSEYIKAYAPVCEQVCTDCEKACLEHKEHIECKACADACVNLVDQIKLRLS